MFRLVDGVYLPGDRTRGGWSAEHLHGGPVSGLLTHAIESQRYDERFLTTRVTFDLMRPVPVAPLSLDARTVRAGRRIRFVDAWITAGDETVARASGVMLRRSDGDPDSASTVAAEPLPHWSELAPAAWMNRPDERRRFGTGLEVRMVGSPYLGQRMAVWVRIPYELLPRRSLTPLERVGTTVDLANGVGIMSQASEIAPFINGDSTFYLFREPLGEWLCLQCVGRGNREGVAVSNVHLQDDHGFFGHAAVSAVRNPLPG